jgi:hypothetical protein
MSQLPPVAFEGTREERVAALVARTSRIFELVAPVRRAALLLEPFSQTIRERHAWLRTEIRRSVRRGFAEELDGLTDSQQRDRITSGSRSRRQHGLSPHPSTRSCARRRADVPSRRSGPGVQALGFAPVPGRGCGFAGRRNFTGKQLKLLKKWWRRRESNPAPESVSARKEGGLRTENLSRDCPADPGSAGDRGARSNRKTLYSSSPAGSRPGFS